MSKKRKSKKKTLLKIDKKNVLYKGWMWAPRFKDTGNVLQKYVDGRAMPDLRMSKPVLMSDSCCTAEQVEVIVLKRKQN